VSHALLKLYAAARATGLLRTPLGDALFNRAYFAYKRFLEDPFATLIRSRPELFRGGHIVDAGANIGYTTVLFARAVEAPYRVIAVEPEEENFARLQRNVRRYGVAQRTELVRAAAGDRDGTIGLQRNEQHPGDHRVVAGGDDVPLVALDSIVAGPVAFVKIDVQGFEPAVLAGMTRILDANPRVTVAVEVSPPSLAELGFTVADVMAPLERRGFAAEKISDHGDYYDLIWRRP